MSDAKTISYPGRRDPLPAPGSAKIYTIGTYTPTFANSGFEVSEAENDRLVSPKFEGVEPGYLPWTTASGIEAFHVGRRVDFKYFPKRVLKSNSERVHVDIEEGLGRLKMVSPAFKACVESLQPGAHQFEPFEMVWDDGTTIGTRYFFVPCRALDTVDEGASTVRRVETYSEYYKTDMRGYWGKVEGPDGKKRRHFIYDLNAVDGETIWVDEYIVNTIFCSDAFIQAYVDAGLVGMVWNVCETST